MGVAGRIKSGPRAEHQVIVGALTAVVNAVARNQLQYCRTGRLLAPIALDAAVVGETVEVPLTNIEGAESFVSMAKPQQNRW